VASGWNELLEEVRRQNAAQARDGATLWRIFEEAAAASSRAKALQFAREFGATLPPPHQGGLAIVFALLLAPIEWPAEWEQARQALVVALDELEHQVDLRNADSLPAALRLEEDPLLLASHSVLMTARDLLQEPCPRDQLAYTARFCNLGTMGCLVVLEQRLRTLPPEMDRVAVQLAQTRFEIAFQKYAQTARSMNAICGLVLFDGLDMHLERA
jgi:hypothetical protein